MALQRLMLRGVELRPESLTLQTVMPRCLGPVSGWLTALAGALRDGYNLIHFTPVQVLGASGSAYSIYSQTTLDPSLFPPVNTICVCYLTPPAGGQRRIGETAAA